jgi:hypothetical protein
MLRERNALVWTLGALLSSGLLYFFWIVLIIKDLNLVAGRPVIDDRQIGNRFALVFLLYLGGILLLVFIYVSRSQISALLATVLVLSGVLPLLFLGYVVDLASRNLKRFEGGGHSYWMTAKYAALSAAWFLSIPMLQHG